MTQRRRPIRDFDDLWMAHWSSLWPLGFALWLCVLAAVAYGVTRWVIAWWGG